VGNPILARLLAAALRQWGGIPCGERGRVRNLPVRPSRTTTPPDVRRLPLSLALLAVLLLAGCTSVRPPEAVLPTAAQVAAPPELQREFRAAWIATVANIDWPSAKGLSTAQQQTELRGLLDRAAALNLNAVIFQIRPHGDALYDSPYEPWSEYLTGAQGQAPEPHYDPLAFAIEEAHRRGMELHAWFNPYRAHHPAARSPIAETHLSQTRPDIVREYGEYLWMDPGEPEIVEHSLGVIRDVVRRYDLDGVHLDDYFYPYPIQDEEGRRVEFPDSTAWLAAIARGETRSRDDWRRDNVDRFVERLYREVKAEKPWVKVGISPFGIWRPGYPEGIRGFDAYAEIYADARRWQQEGWLDYFAPQLYWSIASQGQSYPLLLDWWQEQNTAGRHLWPGNYASRVSFEGEARWDPEELVEQVRLTRAAPGATGNIMFSMKWLLDALNPLGGVLAAEVYGEPALVPASPWLGGERPGTPEVAIERLGARAAVSMRPATDEAVWLWAVRARYGAEWTQEVVPGWQQTHPLQLGPNGRLPDEVAVSAVGRTSLEGPVVRVPLQPVARR
jgi:uncharacterized lipoprotein YddW (UPF0748 family)